MDTYKIKSKSFTAAVMVSGGTVIQAPPALSTFVTGDWSKLLKYAEQHGWIICPVLSGSTSSWIELDGLLYEIHYNKDQRSVQRVSLHEDDVITDLPYNEIPTVIKELL